MGEYNFLSNQMLSRIRRPLPLIPPPNHRTRLTSKQKAIGYWLFKSMFLTKLSKIHQHRELHSSGVFIQLRDVQLSNCSWQVMLGQIQLHHVLFPQTCVLVVAFKLSCHALLIWPFSYIHNQGKCEEQCDIKCIFSQ